jgi:restriction endonuclease S subunit
MSGSVGETGSLGNFAVVHRDDLPCELNQRVGRFRMKPQVRRQFISYFLQSPAFAHPLIVTATSTAQFNVSSDDVGSLWLGLPSEQEQQTIIDYLDWETAKLDALMAKVRAAIERLQEYRTALISAAVTGQIDVRQTQN